MTAFNTKAAIKDALDLVKESYHIVDELDGKPAKSITRVSARLGVPYMEPGNTLSSPSSLALTSNTPA